MRNDNFLLSLSVSILLHLIVIYFLIFGIPYLGKFTHQEDIITFEAVNIDDVTNLLNQNKKIQTQEEVKPEEAKKVLNTEVSKPQDKIKSEEVLKKSEQKLEDKMLDAENIKTKEEKKQEKPKDSKKKETLKNQEEKLKPKKEIKPQKKDKDDDLESLLKTLETSSKGTSVKSNKTLKTQGNAESTSKGPSTGGAKLSITEITLIKNKIHNLWNIPVGAAGVSNIVVTLYISFEKNGAIKIAEIKKIYCPQGIDTNLCKITADNALRAVWRASPMQELRSERFDIWKEFNMDFRP